MRWTPSPHAAAGLAVAAVALLVVSGALGAKLWSAHATLQDRGDALADAEAEVARLQERMRRVEAHVNATAAGHIQRAGSAIAGPYFPTEAQETRIGGRPEFAEQELRRARAHLHVPTPGQRADVLDAVNASISALAWTQAALNAEALPPGSTTEGLDALGDALWGLASVINPRNDAIPTGPDGAITDPVGRAAHVAHTAATNLTHQALDAARATANARADILRASLVDDNGTRRVRVEMAGAIPEADGRRFVIAACAMSGDDRDECVSSRPHWREGDEGPTSALHRVEGAVAWLDAPPVTNATTGIRVNVKARVHGVHAADQCVLPRAGGFACDDPAGDMATGCGTVNGDATACDVTTLRLTVELDAGALANGTVRGAFTLHNQGSFTRVLPLVPNATLSVAVRNASTGGPVAWYGSRFGEPTQFTNADLIILQGGERHTANATFPGAWLTGPGATYRVTATYRPAHDDTVDAEHWTQPVRSATVTVHT